MGAMGALKSNIIGIILQRHLVQAHRMGLRPPLLPILQLSEWLKETVSPGRRPTSNNGFIAYTPSRGLISIRGNWSLYSTCDVVVPHAQTMRDLPEILNIIVVKDESTAGDFC